MPHEMRIQPGWTLMAGEATSAELKFHFDCAGIQSWEVPLSWQNVAKIRQFGELAVFLRSKLIDPLKKRLLAFNEVLVPAHLSALVDLAGLRAPCRFRHFDRWRIADLQIAG
jgi:hypothetical protein